MEPRIIHRPGVGTTAGVLQKQELEFKRLFIDQPVLIVVERGSKALRWAQGEYIIRAGEAIAIAGGQTVDIINRPAADGSYRAFWLVWDAALIAAHALAHPAQPVIRHAWPLPGQPGEFMAAFRRAVDAVEDEAMPADIARHRASEMLLWIGAQGGKFAPAEALTVGIKVRRLIGSDLARDWSAAAIASALAMSEATLRRRLADEDTSLSEILLDARMSFALNLLQCSAQPVTQIAYHVGYQSPSHFAVRFRQRFGFSPSAIRQGALRA
ncbi:AraC family transcriptional regulator [Dechloromonas denitrificans]|uniref:AraC family transcriptional regulator n=1 Tax=Dechloromonas denitrificans TaxID=281362 RepID=A0A133XNN3_9RHOO|nr:AraC family transcriptional regulator [Dechloromonas denitrificans]KXB32552.1 AraC family transcriptional regulator [Dechloromonas denitrificans]